jgi:drug/metabolite transporter (DMT)-like permease
VQRERAGEWFLIAFTLIESWFPIVTLFALQFLTPVFTYAYTLLFSLISFSLILIYKRKLSELVRWSAYKDLLITALLISTMFTLMYIGMAYTTAGNTAVLIFMQFFFSFLYFNVLGSEKIAPIHLAGAFLMAMGALIILFPDNFSFNKGDLFVLLGSAIAPVANHFQKKARQQVSSETVLTFRTLVSIPVLFFIAFQFEAVPNTSQLSAALPYLAIGGFLIMGFSKIFWVEAIHRISITKASAMAALLPVLTLLFAYVTLNEIPDTRQVLGIIPVLLGGFLITRKLA